MDKGRGKEQGKGKEQDTLARDVLEFVISHKARFQGLPGELPDQLIRSALSATLNIAEAAGRVSGRDRKSRFAIARGEICEVAAALDAVHLLGRLNQEELIRVKEVILKVSRMLASLAA